MAFKLNNPPYPVDNTPLYHVDLEEGVLGKALNNGSILMSKDIKDPIQYKEVLAHELGHMQQIKSGALNYDDNNVYYKGKTYSRKNMKEGSDKLPWEDYANKFAEKIT